MDKTIDFIYQRLPGQLAQMKRRVRVCECLSVRERQRESCATADVSLSFPESLSLKVALIHLFCHRILRLMSVMAAVCCKKMSQEVLASLVMLIRIKSDDIFFNNLLMMRVQSQIKI